MGVVYIGDRAVGKTHLAMELANPYNDYVKVSSPDYENLKRLLFDEDLGRTKATDAQNPVDERYLEIQIRLPTGLKRVAVDWVDTPGEIWRKTWQTDRPDQWKNFLEAGSSSLAKLSIFLERSRIASRQRSNLKEISFEPRQFVFDDNRAGSLIFGSLPSAYTGIPFFCSSLPLDSSLISDMQHT